MYRLPIACLLFLSTLAFGQQGITLTERDRDRLKQETVLAIDLIQRYHYKQTPFAEIDSAALLHQFMEDLDGTKLFLTQEDVDFTIARFESSLKPSYLFTGDLFPAFEIYNLYHRRTHDRLQWIANRLTEPFDLTTDGVHKFDRRQADWPANIAEADDLWERRLKNELILEILEGETEERALNTLRRRYERMARFLDDIEVHNVQETFLTALAKLYDPHSNFFSWESAQEFEIQISNALVGIGAHLRDVDGYCVIERLMPGGPAEMSGRLHPGDKIVAVAQGDGQPVDVVGMRLRRIVQMIRGAEGTEVRLTILPADSQTRKEVTLIRERVELTANLARGELFELPIDDSDRTTRIGVIELPSFYGEGTGEGAISTSRDVEELIRRFQQLEVEAIVLDLRRNGGGRLDEAIRVTGLFIPSGPVVMKRSFNGEIDVDWDRTGSIAWDGPLAVLVSRSSASASEIVAGALQVHRRALVVGDPATHGKGTVQAPISLRNAMRARPFSRNMNVGTVKVTVQQFFLPDGASTQSRGVLSDIVLPSVTALSRDGEGDLPNALAWDQIEPVRYNIMHRFNDPLARINDSLLQQLNERSLARQASLPEFDFTQRHIEWVRERRDRKEVSLNLDFRHSERDETEATRRAFEAERNDLGRRLAFPAQPINLRLTESRDLAHQQKLAETPLPNGLPRANNFYQKVFYFKAEGEDKIHEVWVEFFNYDKALQNAEPIAKVLSEALEINFPLDEMESILTRLRNADRGSDFNVLAPFREVLGDRIDETALMAAMPAFFTKLIQLDPEVLSDRPRLDVQLRETLRIAQDWVKLIEPLSKLPLAAKEVVE